MQTSYKIKNISKINTVRFFQLIEYFCAMKIYIYIYWAQDGGVWDRRVCVGSSESLDLKKVESGKYSQERDRRKEQFKREQMNCGQTWKSVHGLEFWELRISVESEAIDWQ